MTKIFRVKESIKMVIESNSNKVGKITLKMDLIYHNPGKSVTVSLPKDLNIIGSIF